MKTDTPTARPVLQNRYRVEERLGASRLAVVYRAYDERLQRTVLVHLLRRELIGQAALENRFLQEAKLGAGRSHRSLLDVYDTGDLSGRPFLITEYIEGRPLREAGAVAPDDALLYLRQIAGAVAACQSAAIPHPPISSTNVILVGDGHVELVESWLTPADDVPRDLACYRPPERTAGAPVTHAGAVYSLGILLIELLSGRRPIDGADAQLVARAHLHAQLPALGEMQPRIYAPALEQLLQQATAADPAERLPNAAALATALDQLRHSLDRDTGPLPALAIAGAPTPVVAPSEAHPAARRMRTRQAEPAAPPAARSISTQPPRNRAIIGLVLIGMLFFVVICGAYSLASSVSANIGSVRLPTLELPLSSLGIALPEWLTGVVEGSGEILEVSIRDTQGLNLRSAPGLEKPVIALLPNGTRLRRLDGPLVVDEVPWLHVRVRIDGREQEGWVSSFYVRAQ